MLLADPLTGECGRYARNCDHRSSNDLFRVVLPLQTSRSWWDDL